MREIKFRILSSGYSAESGKRSWQYYTLPYEHPDDEFGLVEEETIGLYTGLKDKNGDIEIYECDIIDSDGNVIGNQYETPALLEEETNILIQGFGTKDWLTTYTQAVERGCHDA